MSPYVSHSYVYDINQKDWVIRSVWA